MTDQPTLRQRIARAILRYDSQNALSGNDIPSTHHFGEADFVLAELRSELDTLAALRAVARGYCPQCGRGDASPTVTDWEAERQRADQAEEISRRMLEQRQEMAEERYAWQERGDRAEAVLAVRDREMQRLAAARDELAGILAAVLSAFPVDLDPGGPAVRPRYLPAGLVQRWRDRLAALCATEQSGPAATQTAEHVYLSTGCFHGDHAYCQGMTGLNGAKRPGECKHCGAKCICGCHAAPETPGPA